MALLNIAKIYYMYNFIALLDLIESVYIFNLAIMFIYNFSIILWLYPI